MDHLPRERLVLRYLDLCVSVTCFLTAKIIVPVYPWMVAHVEKALTLATTGYTAFHTRLVMRLRQWALVTTTPCDNFPKFLSLPPEVRDLIYGFAMHDLPTRCHIAPWQPPSELVVYPQTLPTICFTSKKVHKEGLHAWLRRTRLIVISASETSPSLSLFLLRVDGFKHIRMLSLHDVITYGVETNGQRLSALVASCPGVTKLHMDINTLSFVDIDPLREDPLRPLLRSSNALKDVLKLDSLTNLKRLRVLTLSACCREEYIQDLLRSNNVRFNTAFANLRVVLEEVFKKEIAAGMFQVTCTVAQ